jgi:REP element-mobilizing transposase RayT
MAQVIHERREEHGFLLTAWVFLPGHWHAIFHPAYPLTISRVMESIKDAATKRINRSRRQVRMLLQPRFLDRALRTVRECHEKVEYIHLNPVKAELAVRPEDGSWSSAHDYTGNVNDAHLPPSGLSVDHVLLPADPATRGFDAMQKTFSTDRKGKSRRGTQSARYLTADKATTLPSDHKNRTVSSPKGT